jgi:hypothetical protein
MNVHEFNMNSFFTESEELLAPGKFLNSQTTDTQIFGFSQRSSEDWKSGHQPDPSHHASPPVHCSITRLCEASNSAGHSTLLPSASGIGPDPTSPSDITADSSRGLATPSQDGPIWHGPRPYLLHPPISKSYPKHWRAWITFSMLGVMGLPLHFNPSYDTAAQMQMPSAYDGQWMLLLRKRLL